VITRRPTLRKDPPMSDPNNRYGPQPSTAALRAAMDIYDGPPDVEPTMAGLGAQSRQHAAAPGLRGAADHRDGGGRRRHDPHRHHPPRRGRALRRPRPRPSITDPLDHGPTTAIRVSVLASTRPIPRSAVPRFQRRPALRQPLPDDLLGQPAIRRYCLGPQDQNEKYQGMAAPYVRRLQDHQRGWG
jgi:hypothetical protein